MNPIQSILIPEYLKKFQCLGSDCSDTCCGGWNVDINKSAFKLYKELIDNTESHPNLLTKKINNNNPELYGTLHLENTMCPLLDNNALCTIHKENGEKSLSNVCASYPKISNVINEVMLQQSALVSCPEIARLALLNKEGIGFILEIFPQNERILINNNTNYNSANSDLRVYFNKIQCYIVDILQNRNLEIEDRMIYLGLLIDNLSKLQLSNTEEQLELLFSEINELIRQNEISGKLSPKLSVQYNFITNIIIPEDLSIIKNLKFLRLIEEIKSKYQSNFSLFESALEHFLQNFHKKYSYIFENYLVNHVYNLMFPFNGNYLFEEYMKLTLNFVFVRFLIISLFHERNGYEEVEIIELIQSYSRGLGQNEKAFNNIVKAVKADGNNNLSFMFLLLKITS